MSLGFAYFSDKFKKTSQIYLLIALILTQISFWPKYISYSKQYSSSWQYGYSQIVSYLKSTYNDYDQIIITKKYGEAHEFVLFYWPQNPSDYQNDSSKDWDYHANWYWVNGFDKFKFVNDWEIKDYTKDLSSDQKTLLVTSPNNYNKASYKLLKTVNFLDNSIAFEILEI
jgi:hypothetical protein